MEFLPLILQLVAGVVGGNAAGMLRPRKSLGPRFNTTLGAIAGVGGGSLLGGVGAGGTMAMLATAAVCGAALPTVLGAFRRSDVPSAQ
jgi:uncharacterized membrane protein YeaQ/YmgE (transglycosylase-associated protein family)